MIGFPALAEQAPTHKGFPGVLILGPTLNPSIAVAVGQAQHFELCAGHASREIVARFTLLLRARLTADKRFDCGNQSRRFRVNNLTFL
jgi:predicted metalloprotease